MSGKQTPSRGKNGRFLKGNPGGPGNPHAAKIVKLRAAMFSAISAADIKAIMAAAIAQAKEGDVQAQQFVFDRIFGKPQSSVELTGGLSVDGEVEHEHRLSAVESNPAVDEAARVFVEALSRANGMLPDGTPLSDPRVPITPGEVRRMPPLQTVLNGEITARKRPRRTPAARLPTGPEG